MRQGSVYITIQPSSSLIQSDWGTAVSSVYTLPATCKGVELAAGASSGVLEIHLLEDSVDKWYLLPLNAEECKGRIFDKIRTTNSTVSLSAVTCFPV